MRRDETGISKQQTGSGPDGGWGMDVSLRFQDLTITVRDGIERFPVEPFETLFHQSHMDGVIMYVTRIRGHIQAMAGTVPEIDCQRDTPMTEIEIEENDPGAMVHRMAALALLVQPDHVITEDRECAELLASLGFHCGYDCCSWIKWSDQDDFPGREPSWLEEGWGMYPWAVNWSGDRDRS